MYFNGSATSTFLVLLQLGLLPVIFVLTFAKRIHHQNHMVNLCKITINIQMFLDNYDYFLLS